MAVGSVELMSVVEGGPSAGAPEFELSLLTKPGCHLCEDARRVLAAVAETVGVTWVEWTADEYPELVARHAEEIPVVFVNGVQRDFWSIDAARLERLLREELDLQG